MQNLKGRVQGYARANAGGGKKLHCKDALDRAPASFLLCLSTSSEFFLSPSC